MLRTCLVICALFLFAGCEKNWRGLMIEKRVYRDGYYVHLPWKRYTPKNEYPKPEPYPVDHSRNAPVDTTRQNVRSVPTDSSGTPRTQTPAGYGYPGGNPTNGGYGTGGPPQAPVNPPQGGYGYPNPNAAPPAQIPTTPTASVPAPQAAMTPPPILEYVEVVDPVLPYRTDSVPSDTAVAVNDSLSIDSTIADEGFHFPEGEVSLIAELGFYNSASARSFEVNPGSYNAGFGARYTIHPFSRHKISAEGSAFVSQIGIRQEQHKRAPLFTEVHDKERIMQWKLRLMLMGHIYVTRSASAFVDAIEVGLFSDIGLFSTHVAIDQHGADDKAVLTRSKTRLFGLKYVRRNQFGMTMRVANDNWSAFVNYRFSSMLRGGSGGEDLPKIVIGITRRFEP